MPLSILMTQCMQRDFVAPLGPHDSRPNALHVGHKEAERLLGTDPTTGPYAQLMHWARTQDPASLQILHIRDWHDRDDPAQAAHLARFGSHCIAGTRGAELVLGLDTDLADRGNERTVDAVGLNDFEGTSLGEVIAALRTDDEPVRVAVVGVWTEAKITFLLYDLLTRCGIGELATCSALTASASRTQHFNALEQLRRILGITVCDSVGEFASWLLPDGEGIELPETRGGMAPRGTEQLSGDDASIVGFLYRDAARVQLDPLAGGFSGASVHRVQSWDALGHAQAPTVIKLGQRNLIAQERVAFERVESILGNNAPSIRGFADLDERAGLKYAFAGMGTGSVRTFKSLWEDGLSPERVEAVLHEVFGELLGRFYAVARYEPLDLLAYYTFAPRHADGVRGRVGALIGQRGDTLRIGGREFPHVANFYANELDRCRSALGRFRYVSYVHGDLNAANILLDRRDNVWLIDFAHAHRGHVLRDVAKLENDVLFIGTRVETERDLEAALELTDALRQVPDLAKPLGPCPVDHPAMRRAWHTLTVLRGIGATICHEDRDPIHLRAALLRYAVHTLWFDESSPLQKQWALASACAHAADITAASRASTRLRIDRVASIAPGRLGITLCPGRRDRDRDLDADLDALVALETRHLLSVLTPEELAWAGAEHIDHGARSRGLGYRLEPIADQGVPTLRRMHDTVTWILAALDRGEDVVVHCMAGLGRSGMVVACCLVARGFTPADAIAEVRRARSPRSVETAAQERFVFDYAERGDA
jgi:hypothetical protein